MAGSGFGRSARILGVGGGWFVAKICMMVMGLVRFEQLMVFNGSLSYNKKLQVTNLNVYCNLYSTGNAFRQ